MSEAVVLLLPSFGREWEAGGETHEEIFERNPKK
jgi:hypothetical protein